MTRRPRGRSSPRDPDSRSLLLRHNNDYDVGTQAGSRTRVNAGRGTRSEGWMGRFDGRVAVVTGAAGQIGAACAEALAAEGADVAAIDLTAPEIAVSAGGRVAPIAADLSDPADLERAFAAAEEALGPVDVLVQSAAVHARVPFLEIDAANIDHVLGINVRAILLGARRAAASMVARGEPGVIVNLTSVSGVVSDAESIAYEASKGAVTMATRSMAVALAPHGIRV